jgi:FtsH-binding integral membrane protein
VILLIFGVRQEWTCWIASALFSFYLGYDIYRSQQYPKTIRNAMASALDIYMDLANIFIRLLEILGKKDN